MTTKLLTHLLGFVVQLGLLLAVVWLAKRGHYPMLAAPDPACAPTRADAWRNRLSVALALGFGAFAGAGLALVPPPEASQQIARIAAYDDRFGPMLGGFFFGLACAALVARGFLAQDDLWPALRLHGEQVLSAMLASIRGSVAFVAGRVAEDGPSPFGALSGAAVFVRAFLLAHDVGTLAARAQRRPFKVVPGPYFEGREDSLGGTEAARDLEPILDQTIDARSLPALGPALATLEALALLGVVAIVDALPAESERAPATPLASPLASASLDADALRLRIGARRKLVDEGDYFALLGVSPRANAFEIRQAYLELRRTFEPARVLQHPELRAFEEDLRVILEVVEEAYVVLRDDARRERYRRAIGLAS